LKAKSSSLLALYGGLVRDADERQGGGGAGLHHKLERIQQLWHEPQREIPESPRCKAIPDQIRVL
jgi:hypothetical protein